MSHAELCRRAESALRAVPASLTPPVLVGFDGFVDSIADVVATRADDEHYTAFNAIDAFGARVREAAGKSANFEVYVKQVKIGGNGPIMANALCSYRYRVTAVGILGEGAIHSAFADLRGVRTGDAPVFLSELEVFLPSVIVFDAPTCTLFDNISKILAR